MKSVLTLPSRPNVGQVSRAEVWRFRGKSPRPSEDLPCLSPAVRVRGLNLHVAVMTPQNALVFSKNPASRGEKSIVPSRFFYAGASMGWSEEVLEWQQPGSPLWDWLLLSCDRPGLSQPGTGTGQRCRAQAMGRKCFACSPEKRGSPWSLVLV